MAINYAGVFREDQMLKATKVPLPVATTTTLRSPFGFNSERLQDYWIMIFLVSTFMIVALSALYYRSYRMKAIRNRAFGLRKTDIAEEDEDDLLISSLYSQ